MRTYVTRKDGKYTIVVNEDGTYEALRYWEPWPAANPPSNMTVSLAHALLEAGTALREIVKIGCVEPGPEAASRMAEAAKRALQDSEWGEV